MTFLEMQPLLMANLGLKAWLHVLQSLLYVVVPGAGRLM